MQTAGDSVAQQLSWQHHKEVEGIRRNARKLLEVVLLCKQNMPFHGHDESQHSNNRGNYLEILHWIEKVAVLKIADYLRSKELIFL